MLIQASWTLDLGEKVPSVVGRSLLSLLAYCLFLSYLKAQTNMARESGIVPEKTGNLTLFRGSATNKHTSIYLFLTSPLLRLLLSPGLSARPALTLANRPEDGGLDLGLGSTKAQHLKSFGEILSGTWLNYSHYSLIASLYYLADLYTASTNGLVWSPIFTFQSV
ncbi:hypothetical protein QBC45DRAFT_38536 [Copromyces sp. CBS 386.78]|nr:hypothetical protein QBC45DRAFT_38536 [Copromyces sp. CBS 386.78]